MQETQIKTEVLKCSENMTEKGDGPCHGFGSDPLGLKHGIKENYFNFATFNKVVDTTTSILD